MGGGSVSVISGVGGMIMGFAVIKAMFSCSNSSEDEECVIINIIGFW